MTIKILAVNDDPAMAELLTFLLQSYNFEIKTASSASEGIQLIQQLRPNIILLDLMMADINGWDTCRKIRGFSNIPILVLSAINNPEIVARALDAGADDYLIKPISSSLLVAHIKNLARRSTAELRPLTNMMRRIPSTTLAFS